MSSLQCATTLLLARHGDAEYETDLWTDDGGSLSTLGRGQSADLAARLASRRIAHVWTSTLSRAVQTAEIVAARLGVGVTTREGLRELGCGAYAGTPMADDPFRPTFGAWLDGDLDARIRGGESGRETVDRMRLVLQEIADAHPGESVLVVSHGGVLSLAVPLLGGLTERPAPLDNCATVELAIDADGWVCRSWA